MVDITLVGPPSPHIYSSYGQLPSDSLRMAAQIEIRQLLNNFISISPFQVRLGLIQYTVIVAFYLPLPATVGSLSKLLDRLRNVSQVEGWHRRSGFVCLLCLGCVTAAVLREPFFYCLPQATDNTLAGGRSQWRNGSRV